MIATTASQPIYLFRRAILPWLICGMGMLFYFYNLFLRVSPSVMHEELMSGLHIGAYQFGSLAAFYYYAYTPMQLPAGILYDRYGVRLVQFFAVITALLGLTIFIYTNTYTMACLGRYLIGLGGAFAYIGVMKLASNWLPANRFGLAAGLTTTFGMSAAIFSDMYLTKFVQLVGYQDALKIGLAMGVGIAAIILLFMRNAPAYHHTHKETTPFAQVLQGLKIILISKQMWLIGIIGCLTYLPSSVFLDLWGIPYLKAAHHLSAEAAAYIASITFIGWIIGGPIIGAISDHLQKRIMPLILCYSLAAILFIYVFYRPNISLSQMYICFFLIGATCSSHPLCIALGKENNNLIFSGISVAFSNCLTMVGGVIFQPLVGKLLDWHAGNSVLTTHNYSGSDFTYALSIVPIGLALSILLSFWLKE